MNAGGWTLRCENVRVQRGAHLALRDVQFTLRAGECVCLIGPNGSGKSTLLLTALGLLSPRNGSVMLNERPMPQLTPRERARFAAYVPQSLDGVPAQSVREVVAGGRYCHGSWLGGLSAADRMAVDAALDACGLRGLADRSLRKVSGGERQKALLAAALAQDAPLLVLDEPTTGLDPAIQLELVELLARFRMAGRTLLISSHDLDVPLRLATRVVALRDGRVAADGARNEILRPELLESLFGAPFVHAQGPDGVSWLLPHRGSGLR